MLQGAGSQGTAFRRALRAQQVCCSQVPEGAHFPPTTYVLVLRVERATSIQVGKLATADFPAGWLYYVGSARRAAQHRLRRHFERQKKLHWHIDYLTTSPALRFWGVLGWQSAEQRECALVGELASRTGLEFAVPGFGTGDCRSGCTSHLLFAPDTAVHQRTWSWLLSRDPAPFLRCSRPACSETRGTKPAVTGV